MNVRLEKNQMLVVIALLVLGSTGCAKLPIEASGTPQAKCPSGTVWKSYYGFSWSDFETRKATNGIGLYQTTIYSNYCYSLISVISLGTVVPIQYEYQLQEPPITPPSSNTDDDMRPTKHLKH